MDDLSWQSVSIDGYQNELISLVAIILCIILKIGRKYCYEIDDFNNTIKLYFFTSQVRFLIPWALTILNCYLFYNIFGCYDVLPEIGFYI
jgi:chromate transport protein ChrA